MSDPAISRTKAAMKAAAKANGTAGSVKKMPEIEPTDATVSSARFLGFRDRLLVDSHSSGNPVLVKAWQQAAGAFGGAALVCGLAAAAVIGLSNHKAHVIAEVERRDAEVRVALDLISQQIESQQTALFDAAAMERGLILVDSRGVDIKTLMAENERLLSTLDAALSLTDAPIEAGELAAENTLASLGDQSSDDIRVMASELALHRTQKELLSAELDIERQTIEKMAIELASSRQTSRALEREAIRLNTSLDGRDESIAVLKRDLISMQTGQTDTDAARRRATQLLHEQNAELMAELASARGALEEGVLAMKSLEARLSQSEADTTRLNSLLLEREEQIASLTLAQNDILDRLETKVEDQMADVQKAIDITGVNQDTAVNFDALLDSVSNPFWNGMGGLTDESDIELEEFAVSEDDTTNLINGLFDRALMIEMMTEELEHRQSHFDGLPTFAPVKNLRISSIFGMRKHPISGKYRMHKGLDFAGPSGSRVAAAGPGKIVYAARKGSYGNLVEIDHGNGVVTRYAHLRKIAVKKGADVTVGQKIGEVGSTGASTGPHLHWEVLVFDQAKDPQQFLDARKAL